MKDTACEFFKALGHPLRIQIVKELYDGPTCVCHINDNIESSQANISKHLRILKNGNVLSCKKVGMYTYYSLTDEKIKDVVKIVEEMMK
ncbi:MAG: ArsR/SmtB family transcription factor [Clostridium sp.]|uniref:ArsR/SmtB family transcription factor n=1 Tax=Clostridium TaxID=1485 RepID=UPI0021538110|nr:metalloregulator ArsR/SmtB family transcription factor [Clostridium sp. LY3-2]MCR6515491.1 metalloregulator ArsR/SmtB family transcription factor [Clostridium sp. LY3-2]